MSLLDASETNPTEGGASYSLANRIQRVLWIICWRLLASWTPSCLYRWRVCLLRTFGADVDWTAHVYPSAKIWLPSHLTMARHSCLGPNVNCYNMAKMTFGEHAIVSQGAHLCGGSHDVDDEHFQLIAKPITIERFSWVAAEAFVGPGVTVAEYSVLGARGVAFKDTEPHGIYAGNPAKLIRYRRDKPVDQHSGSHPD